MGRPGGGRGSRGGPWPRGLCSVCRREVGTTEGGVKAAHHYPPGRGFPWCEGSQQPVVRDERTSAGPQPDDQLVLAREQVRFLLATSEPPNHEEDDYAAGRVHALAEVLELLGGTNAPNGANGPVDSTPTPGGTP